MESVSSTDSVGTQSDISGHTTVTGRPRMDVACVLDLQQSEHLAQRKRALDEVRQACNLVNANIHHIQVYIFIQKLTKRFDFKSKAKRKK